MTWPAAIAATAVNPKWMANIMASTALNTEAQPFTPQAQGTSSGARADTRDKPSGNGIPIAKASGAMIKIETITFAGSGQVISHRNSSGSNRRYNSERAAGLYLVAAAVFRSSRIFSGFKKEPL